MRVISALWNLSFTMWMLVIWPNVAAGNFERSRRFAVSWLDTVFVVLFVLAKNGYEAWEKWARPYKDPDDL